jgi:hypothetical protein
MGLTIERVEIMQTIKLTDEIFTWQGHISMEERDGGLLPWKVDYRELALYHKALLNRVGFPAGMRLSFRTDSRNLEVLVKPDEEFGLNDIPVDLVVGDEVLASRSFTPDGRVAFEDLPEGPKNIEMWLPMWGHYVWQTLSVDDGAVVERWSRTGPKLITYGSSITVCYDAASPTRTWSAIVARKGGFDLTCMATGGSCHLDTMMALNMRDHEADFIILELGINIHGQGSLSERTFRQSIIGFIKIIREKQPDTPILLISPIYCEAREDTENKVGLTLKMMRDEIVLARQAFVDFGDRNIHYLSGLELLGENDTHGLQTDDWLHPNAEGYEMMGNRLAAIMKDRHFTEDTIQ